jgi:hypothetical protein
LSVRPSTAATILAVLAIVLALLGAYVGVRVQGQTRNVLGNTVYVTQVIYKSHRADDAARASRENLA